MEIFSIFTLIVLFFAVMTVSKAVNIVDRGMEYTVEEGVRWYTMWR